MKFVMRYSMLCIVLATVINGCSSDAPLFCDVDQPCTAGHPYCDLDGVCPASGGHANTCIPEACWDAGAGVVDASPGAADADVVDAASVIDAEGADAAPPITWGDIQLVSNVNSTSADLQPSISADGLELYFSSNRPGGDGLSDIWLATRATPTAAFGNPVRVAELSTASNELGPEISTDGKELFFVRGFLMVSTRANASVPWGTPVSLGFPGVSPALTGDGLTLYYVDSGSPSCGVPGFCIKKRSRASIGAAWGPVVDVPLPGGLQYHNVDVSSDDLGLIVSGPAVAQQPLAQQSWRSSIDDDFDVFEPIPALTYDLQNDGAAWNKSETEIYLHSDRVMGVGSYDIYVSLPE